MRRKLCKSLVLENVMSGHAVITAKARENEMTVHPQALRAGYKDLAAAV